MPKEVHPEIPHNMTRFARNRRLYDHLFAMGLFVDPVLVDGNPDKIDSLIVATTPWTVNLLPADVASPVKGPEVGDIVTTSVGDRENVIDFPTVSGRPVAIRRE